MRRVLIGLQSTGVTKVLAMPDSGNLCRRAADDADVELAVEMLPMSPHYTEGDTMRAAAAMAEQGVGCLVTLGGDGTNRAVAVGTNQVPIVAISTGTNNIFPVMVEGTQAGIAAGIVASGRLDCRDTSVVSKTLQVAVNGQPADLALVDVAISRERYVASRAIWDLDTVYEVFLTVLNPLESACLRWAVGCGLCPWARRGLRYRPGLPDGDGAASVWATTVIAPVAPGLVKPVPIADWGFLQEGVRVDLEPRHCTVALDGERTLTITPDDRVQIVLARNGPPVVQVQRTLRRAAEKGLFGAE